MSRSTSDPSLAGPSPGKGQSATQRGLMLIGSRFAVGKRHCMMISGWFGECCTKTWKMNSFIGQMCQMLHPDLEDRFESSRDSRCHFILIHRDSKCHSIARSDQKLNSGMMIQSIEFSSCQTPLNLFCARLDQKRVRLWTIESNSSDQKLNSSMMIQSVEIISCWIPLNLFHARSDQRFNSCDSIHVHAIWIHFLPSSVNALVSPGNCPLARALGEIQGAIHVSALGGGKAIVG